jgi:uncharacterized membrane protein YhdT
MSEPENKSAELHWLVRPRTIRWLWGIFGVVLGLTVAAGLVIESYGHFGLDGTFGFHAWYGFAACVAMVVVAKLLGVLVKRPETYYTDSDV